MGNKKAVKAVEKQKKLKNAAQRKDSADLKSYLIASLKNQMKQASFQLCTCYLNINKFLCIFMVGLFFVIF